MKPQNTDRTQQLIPWEKVLISNASLTHFHQRNFLGNSGTSY